MRGRGALNWSVRPRYTCGSPAAVHEEMALKVAKEEREDHAEALTGIYGEIQRTRAEKLGLTWIAEETRERAGGWDVFDLLTREYYFRPTKWKKDETLEFWDDENGWISAVTITAAYKGSISAAVRRLGGERAPREEVSRGRLRVPGSVKKIEEGERPW